MVNSLKYNDKHNHCPYKTEFATINLVLKPNLHLLKYFVAFAIKCTHTQLILLNPFGGEDLLNVC